MMMSSKTKMSSGQPRRPQSTKPTQGLPAGLILDAAVAARPLDEADPVLPFCFRLLAGFVAELVSRDTALLTEPISELVTESTGDDGRSMSDEPRAVPTALPVTPTALPAPGFSNGMLSPWLDPVPVSPRRNSAGFPVGLPIPLPALPGALPALRFKKSCALASPAPRHVATASTKPAILIPL